MKIFSDNDFIKFLENTARKEYQHVWTASSWTDSVIARLNGKNGVYGDLLPWSKTHNKVQLRPGEVSIWAGINGHGKSLLLGQVCAFNLQKNWLIASMEMKPEATLARMMRQIAGARLPSDEFVRDFLHWTDDRLWIYDQVDTVKQDRILGMIYWAAKILNINHVVIDSLMKCGIGTDDHNSQKAFVDKLCWIAKNEDIHIHLVHHVRKGDRENRIPDKFDIKGASEITDLVDNVFIHWRNKGKEEKVAAGAIVDEPDAILKVAKQRHGEWEGTFQLWHHNDSLQFIGDSNNRTIMHRRNAA